MSDTSQGPGWWQASDGNWYPPEDHPDARGATPEGGYPIGFDTSDDNEVDNWRPLVHWILWIPHAIIAYVLGYVAQIIWIISIFVVLFTAQMPQGLVGLQAMILRYQNRAYAFFLGLQTEYPPFTFDTTAADPGNDVSRTWVREPGRMNRFLPIVKTIALIPHAIVLLVLSVAAAVVAIIAWFAVLFTGRYPQGLRSFMIGVFRWRTRVIGYLYNLTGDYPPFSLD